MAFRALVRGLILVVFALSLAPLPPAQAVVPELRQPAWSELSPEQKQILAPLSRDWDKMEAFRKKKWLGIAKRYPTMKPEEQARVQRRMEDWAKLTPEQRSQARERYKSLKTVPPEQKAAIREKWEQYKELPEEEKKRLAKSAEKKRQPRPHALAPMRPAAPQPAPAAAPAAAEISQTPVPVADGAASPPQGSSPAASAQPAPEAPPAASPAVSQ